MNLQDEELQREDERSAAVTVLLRAGTSLPVDVVVDLVCIELQLSQADRARRWGWIKLHISSNVELPKNTRLRPIVVDGDLHLSVAELVDGQASIFSIQDAPTPMPSQSIAANTPSNLRQVSIMVVKEHYDELALEAKRLDVSVSHMFRAFAREWYEKQHAG